MSADQPPSDPGRPRPFDRSQRVSGVLCHGTSLPTTFGVGDLGPTSIAFIDFLADAGQSIWQWLPVGPPAHNNSPYSCYSALAGNRVLISPDGLLEDDLVTSEQVEACKHQPVDTHRVEFEAVHDKKTVLLAAAYQVFASGGADHLADAFAEFKTRSASWLIDFARFEALVDHFGQLDWSRWPDGLPQRDSAALQKWDQQLAEPIDRSCFIQFLFDRQWSRMKQHAKSRGVRLCGDMPIFVAHESSDVWAGQALFCLDDARKPSLVAGVPPDYFSKTGQLWGNPLYDWQAIQASDFAWWTQRFTRSLEQFDLMRVDHFRGFEAFWEIPAGEKTAVNGRWVEGPGIKPFRAAQSVLGPLPLIAEDLGMITQAVYQLRDELDYPGMRVMQFGFDQDDDHFHRPSGFPAYSVAYTGTHDNDTLMGWYKNRKSDPDFARRIAADVASNSSASPNHSEPSHSKPSHWDFIDMVLDSDAFITLFPVQDLLGLGSEARMNVPGKAKGNWSWCLEPGQLTPQVAQEMSERTQKANR